MYLFIFYITMVSYSYCFCVSGGSGQVLHQSVSCLSFWELCSESRPWPTNERCDPGTRRYIHTFCNMFCTVSVAIIVHGFCYDMKPNSCCLLLSHSPLVKKCFLRRWECEATLRSYCWWSLMENQMTPKRNLRM